MKNQLQFSLSKGPSADNLVSRHQKLQPVIVEKIGMDAKKSMPPVSMNINKAFQFSTLSQDKLEMAVQLAKRDIKKKRAEEEMKINNVKGGRKSLSPQGRKGFKSVKSLGGRDASRQKQVDSKTRSTGLKIRERIGKGHLSKAPKRNQRSNFQRTDNYSPRANSPLPVTTNSPPTKDVNPRKALSKDEQQISEIHRLHKEIQLFLLKIESLVQTIVDGDMTQTEVRNVRGQDDLYLRTEEGEVRRRLRSEEHATRSARTMYFLKQQVRGIQEELNKFGLDKIRQTKQSQMLTRLASAHRGAVRALHTFISQLQSHVTRDGPPPGYVELSSLIKQVTSLSSQLTDEQTDKLDVQTDDTNSLLEHIQDLCSVWEEESRIIVASQKQKSSPERRERTHQGEQRGQRLRENRARGVLKKPSRKPLSRPLSPAKVKSQGQRNLNIKHSSPERKAALKAGIAALVRADNSKTRQERGGNSVNPPQKGLLLPHNLKHRRPVVEESLMSGHYADPTMAFNLKAVTPQRNPITEPRSLSAPSSPSRVPAPMTPSKEPHWVPAGSNAHTPQRTPRSRSHSPGCMTCARYRGSMEDLSVELFSEEKRPRPVKGHVHFSRSRSRSPSPSYGRRSPKRHTEQEIHRKMAPLYLTAQDLGEKHESAVRANQTRRRDFMVDPDLDKQTQGEVLTELLFNDLLTDTAEELQTIQGDNSVTNQALRLMESPSVSRMMYRLEQMQIERDEIRQRWKCVTFDDPDIDRLDLEQCAESEPSHLEINSRVKGSITSSSRLLFSLPDNEPILFTKSANSRLKSSKYNTGNDSRAGNPMLTDLLPKVKVQMSEEVMKAIWENLEEYEGHLKRTLYSTTGTFDPWQLVKEVSDEILEDCLTEVAGELEDMSSDIVNHLYTAEFEMTSPPSSD